MSFAFIANSGNFQLDFTTNPLKASFYLSAAWKMHFLDLALKVPLLCLDSVVYYEGYEKKGGPIVAEESRKHQLMVWKMCIARTF